jgi:3',5'-cyclic AMP phosphodiesterase CpdA
MKSIIHLSDLHFGTEDQNILTALLGDLDGVTAVKPTLVAISGDLTQRARQKQFHAARHFLDNLLVPYVVVPGNHDVPLYDVVRRFFAPLDLYKQFITDDLCPSFVQDDLAVMGITTAHGFTRKNGRVSRALSERVCATLGASAAPWKVLVAHHPFVIPAGVDETPVVGAEQALPRFESCGVDVILSGHMHVAFASDVAGYRSDDHKVICVHAGTAISTRLRGEPQGYNRLVFDGDLLTVYHRVWNGTRFVDGPSKMYRRVERAGHVELDKLMSTAPHVPLEPVTRM